MTPRLHPGPWRMPAEWEPHERCVMAWPVREDLWGKHLAEARREYAATIEAISVFEPVTLVVNPGTAREVRKQVPDTTEIWEIPIDDSWTRDSGPIITVDGDGERSGVDFAFNSWGGKYAPWDKDAASSARMLEELGIPRRSSPMVLEGGAITVDGDGTLITTEQCLLNENRNPEMRREQTEAELASSLGVRDVVWLPWGLAEDRDTDGHVDGVAAFVRPGAVLAQTCEDPANPNFDRLAQNLAALRSAVDAGGRDLEIIEMPDIPYFDFHGEPIAAAYVNFYLANGGVVVPVADIDMDQEALAIIRRAFPGREVIGVRSRAIAYGGGGTHCITQQVPQKRVRR
jgi:agmatine deiminase